MSTEGLFLSFGLLVISLLFLALPLIGRRTSMDTATVNLQKKRDELLVDYERALMTIRDLDADYEMGKVHTVEYETERQQWAAFGVQKLQALESMDPSLRSDSPAKDNTEDYDAAIEDAVRGYLQQASQSS